MEVFQDVVSRQLLFHELAGGLTKPIVYQSGACLLAEIAVGRLHKSVTQYLNIMLKSYPQYSIHQQFSRIHSKYKSLQSPRCINHTLSIHIRPIHEFCFPVLALISDLRVIPLITIPQRPNGGLAKFTGHDFLAELLVNLEELLILLHEQVLNFFMHTQNLLIEPIHLIQQRPVVLLDQRDLYLQPGVLICQGVVPSDQLALHELDRPGGVWRFRNRDGIVGQGGGVDGGRAVLLEEAYLLAAGVEEAAQIRGAALFHNSRCLLIQNLSILWFLKILNLEIVIDFVFSNIRRAVHYYFQKRMGKEFTQKDKARLQAKKAKQKQRKHRRKEQRQANQAKRQQIRKNLTQKTEQEIAEVAQENQNILTGKYYEQFQKVFERAQAKAARYTETPEMIEQKKAEEKPTDAEDKPAEEKVSRKKKKMLRWLRVAQLKAIVKRPDLVEAWDITAMDPLFLNQLKCIKNTVPVPRHWNQKSKFLQSKRGILKPMFKLPEFIEATGISKLRDPFSERDGQKMVREKLRERMNPRLGKIDIDYAVLHDAFFKYQTKSKMTTFGDTYYEGKEEQAKAKQFKPGVMSQQLRMALGISDYQAPPWIINIQRYGAPPSYPTLRILGCNAPFSQLNSYSMISKTNLEQAAKKSGHAGLYATFKSYYDEDEDPNVDKGYWGEVNDEELIEEEEEMIQEEDQEMEQFG